MTTLSETKPLYSGHINADKTLAHNALTEAYDHVMRIVANRIAPAADCEYGTVDALYIAGIAQTFIEGKYVFQLGNTDYLTHRALQAVANKHGENARQFRDNDARAVYRAAQKAGFVMAGNAIMAFIDREGDTELVKHQLMSLTATQPTPQFVDHKIYAILCGD